MPGDYRPRFEQNTEPYQSKIILRADASGYALRDTPDNSSSFAIVDGSHQAADVLEDAVLSWRLLKSGGVMIFDDYAWTGQGHANCAETDKPRIAVNAFIDVYRPEILQMGYQAIVRKP